MMKVFLQEAVPENEPIPGAVIAIQSFGDFLGFNPHCHILVTDSCFYGNGMFRVAPPLELKKLLVPFRVEAIFRHEVFRMLLAKGKISRELIAMLSSRRHSGFHVFCGNRISPNDETAMENWRAISSTLKGTSRNGCSIWIRKGRLSIHPKTAGQARASPPWNGWPTCILIYRTGVSRWCGTKDHVTLSETSVQLAIITSIENRKNLDL